MARVNPTHKDVEFAIDDPVRGEEIWSYFPDAVAHAVMRAASTGQKVVLDVLVYSKSGALWWGGDEAVENYLEDPEASVFQRVEIRAEDLGRVS